MDLRFGRPSYRQRVGGHTSRRRRVNSLHEPAAQSASRRGTDLTPVSSATGNTLATGRTATMPCPQRDPRRVLFLEVASSSRCSPSAAGGRSSAGHAEEPRRWLGVPSRTVIRHRVSPKECCIRGPRPSGASELRLGLDDDAAAGRTGGRARRLSEGAARQTEWSLSGFSRATGPERERRGTRTVMMRCTRARTT